MAEGSLLTCLRVLDLSSGPSEAVSRILADLGADVLKIEPPGGSSSRGAAPSVAGAGIAFALQQRQQALRRA